MLLKLFLLIAANNFVHASFDLGFEDDSDLTSFVSVCLNTTKSQGLPILKESSLIYVP